MIDWTSSQRWTSSSTSGATGWTTLGRSVRGTARATWVLSLGRPLRRRSHSSSWRMPSSSSARVGVWSFAPPSQATGAKENVALPPGEQPVDGLLALDAWPHRGVHDVAVAQPDVALVARDHGVAAPQPDAARAPVLVEELEQIGERNLRELPGELARLRARAQRGVQRARGCRAACARAGRRAPERWPRASPRRRSPSRASRRCRCRGRRAASRACADSRAGSRRAARRRSAAGGRWRGARRAGG